MNYDNMTKSQHSKPLTHSQVNIHNNIIYVGGNKTIVRFVVLNNIGILLGVGSIRWPIPSV